MSIEVAEIVFVNAGWNKERVCGDLSIKNLGKPISIVGPLGR